MPYKELKSFYYKKDADYAQEYLSRFNSDEAVKIDFTIGDRQAFFLQNGEVMTLAYQIALLDKEIAGLCRELPGVAIGQYTKRCLIDEIVVTNKIEGVRSSRKEIGEALDILESQSKRKGKQQRFLGLVNKYMKLIDDEPISLQTCEDIRGIYDELFLEEVVHEDAQNRPDGVLFRKSSVFVYDERDKIIHEGLHPEDKIIEAVSSALQFLNNSPAEELLRICVFHYLIEYIHPFYDGNGRLGRFLLSYGISRRFSPLVSFRISETIKENITKYYKAFKTCNDQRNLGDLTPFLLMQLSMIRASMEDLKTSLREKLATWTKYEQMIAARCEDEKLFMLYSYLTQAALFGEKGISVQELEQSMGLSSYKIGKLMKEIPGELIVVRKKGNAKFYSLDLNKWNSIIFNDSLNALAKTE